MKGVEGVLVQWCNPLILKPKQTSGVGSVPSRNPPLERHDKGTCSISAIPALGAEKRNFTFTIAMKILLPNLSIIFLFDPFSLLSKLSMDSKMFVFIT